MSVDGTECSFRVKVSASPIHGLLIQHSFCAFLPNKFHVIPCSQVIRFEGCREKMRGTQFYM